MAKELNSSVKILEKSNLRILVNLSNGSWARIRPDLLSILVEGLENNFDPLEIPNKYPLGGRDKEILSKLIPKLDESNFFQEQGTVGNLPFRASCKHDKVITWLVTLRCNLSCRHCSVSAGPSASDQDLSASQLILILEKMLPLDLKGIVISGGEPFLRKDIFELLANVRGLFYGEVSVQTNATLITKEIADELVKDGLVDRVDVSLDGVDEQSCAPIRGPGTFIRAIAGIKNLQRAGFNDICTSIVLTKTNQHLRSEFVALNEDLGTNFIFRTFTPAGRGKENRNEFELSFSEEVDQVEESIKKKVASSEDPDFKNQLRLQALRQTKAKSQCSAGISTYAIAPNGDLFPCPLLMDPQFHMGNLTVSKSLLDIIQRPRNQNLIRSFSIDERSICRDCDVRYFCGGGCMGETLEKTGSHVNPDWDCDYIKRNLTRFVWGVD